MIASSFSEKCISVINGAPSWAVFFFFYLLDAFLCIVFRFLDEVMEEKLESCHCKNPQEKTDFAGYEFLSETLYRRRNVFRQAGFLRFAKKLPEITKKIGIVTFLRKFLFSQTMKKVSHEVANRWSDCGCKTCVSWTNSDKLNVIVKQPSISDLLISNKPVENVILIFIITEKTNYRFFAVDLLGFGDSPKPRASQYSFNEHVEMIEKSVILPNNLTFFSCCSTFHGMYHCNSLNCKILRQRQKEQVVMLLINVIAEKKLWPPTSFFTSMMAWYEHIGRGDGIYSMHNVICGGAKFTDKHLETLIKSGVKINVVQGDKDVVVPIDCLWNMKGKFPAVEVEVIAGTDHSTVIMSRREVFVASLVSLWASSQKKQKLVASAQNMKTY
ncbi:hypothetical protein ARALYDRAFT_326200 [Arabidopsis lyrata subsp. lyrata]|uniref:Uncharacterized protein n=1 Tax=Arabidopsis lyrata subsp. lyrata TaxID=81972 RepID=D7LX39_ARALL|nr:hypothetical protein ARALYDRAFT_326200 [Arabidopsis lyrata subsp. lyrata]